MKTKQTFYVLLGILNIKPMSAYEIKQFVANNTDFFWSESYGNIHKNLQILLKDQLVEIKSISKEGREKIIFQITENGKEMLKTWIHEYPQEVVLKHELLMKMLISSKEDIYVLKDFIVQEREQSQVAEQILRTIQQSIEEMDINSYRKKVSQMTLNFGIKYSLMTINWCEETLVEIEAMRTNSLE